MIQIIGKVIKGAGDGKKIGFPTANIDFVQKVDLEFGVYACKIKFNNQKYQGVAHFGPRLVFDEKDPQLEVYIFDFDEDIYDKFVVVELNEKMIRETEKFADVEEMKKRIEQDCIEAKKILNSN